MDRNGRSGSAGTITCVQCVLRLAPLRGYRKVIRRGPVKHCWTPGARVSTLLGRSIREGLSVFLHNLRVGIEAAVEQQQKAKDALRIPFTTTTNANTEE
jgi:hypothetical protein